MAHRRLIKQLSIVMIPLLVMILTASSAARLGKTAVEAGGGCEKVTCPAGQICVVQCLDSCQPVCNETGGDQGEKGAGIRGEKGRGKGRKAGKGKGKGQGNQSGDDEGTH